MSNFKVYPTSLISLLNDSIPLLSSELGATGPTGANGPNGIAGSNGATGPTGAGASAAGVTQSFTMENAVSAGDIVKANIDGSVTDYVIPNPQTFENSNLTYNSCCYDSTNDRIVIAYTDVGNSSFGTAVVGEVDVVAKTITFGTPVVFESASTGYISCCYDSTSDRVVIAYRDTGNSSFGTAIVGAVNPATNAITFGTAVVFESATTVFTSCVYDPVADRVVIAYRDLGNSSFGTAIVGNVDAGTESITFGTAVVFNSATTAYIFSVYDPVENRVLIVYQDFGNSFFGTAIVGNVDAGTESITFGTAVVFESAVTDFSSCVYDSVADRVVIVYADGGNLNRGTAIVGNVDAGTESITFGTAVVFESGTTNSISCVYDSTLDRVVIGYRDVGNSNFGTAIVGNVDAGTESITFRTAVVFESINATLLSCTNTSSSVIITYNDETNSLGRATIFPKELYSDLNILGISQSAISAASSGSILLFGVDNNQSGLTPGKLYYWDYTTGTLTTTNTYPLVGLAVTSTSIKIG